MNINELSSCLAASRLYGDGETEISDLQTDSRKVKPGDLFICLPGHTVDGHKFARLPRVEPLPSSASGGWILICPSS